MRFVLGLIVALLFVLFCTSASVTQEKYTDRYDGVDLRQVLGNLRLLQSYIKCLLDKGRCSQEGRELKSHIKEALSNNCLRCTAAQRLGVRRVFSHLVDKEPGYWAQLLDKYDPERKYVAEYQHELTNIRH